MRSVKIISLLLVPFTIVFAKRAFASDGSVCRVETEDKSVALTFDDGPHCKYTEEILDILREYGVKATFFIIGSNAENYPSLVQREIGEGHEVESHTYDHKYLKCLDYKDTLSEIEKNEEVINSIAGTEFRLIRPPGGLYGDTLKKLARERGYRIVLWSVDTEDWRRPAADHIVKYTLSAVKSGDIILMHDFVSGRSSTPEALRTIIPSLLSEGYRFVTVSELIDGN